VNLIGEKISISTFTISFPIYCLTNDIHKVDVIQGVLDEDIEIFHFQNSTLITNSYEGVLKVWNLDTLEYERTLNNQDGEIVWFEFLDNVLASSHLVNSGVNIFDMRTGMMTIFCECRVHSYKQARKYIPLIQRSW